MRVYGSNVAGRGFLRMGNNGHKEDRSYCIFFHPKIFSIHEKKIMRGHIFLDCEDLIVYIYKVTVINYVWIALYDILLSLYRFLAKLILNNIILNNKKFSKTGSLNM